MKKDVQSLVEKIINAYKRKKLWSYAVSVLSCIAICITIYQLMSPAMSFSRTEIDADGDGIYKLHLIDSYQDLEGATELKYSWKKSFYNTTSPNYDLDLYFEDDTGNVIKGKDVTVEVGPNALSDKIYGFGGVPISDDGKNTVRGIDLIDKFDLGTLVADTGEKYEFVGAKVQLDDTGVWYVLETSNYWNIWCQYSGQTTVQTEYGWRGDYIDASGVEKRYQITNLNKDNVKFKFIYKKVRYGNFTTDSEKTVKPLELDSGISFKMFNYSGNLSGTGDNNINNNGTYNYFAFRDSSLKTATQNSQINSKTDADGFGSNRARVEAKLGADTYPVFDCKSKGGCANNFSLGYLFGATTNPAGAVPNGVTAYNPNNTLLQKESINGTDYYYYDSSRNAVDYDVENDYFMVRDYVERGQSMTSYPVEAATRYEFIPFNYLNDESTDYTASNGVTYQHQTVDLDHWFGMTMEFEFYMPKDGKINGEDMIFSFSGDDDVWVFIDDVLVLDLGGTHGAVDGNINFATGEVEGYLNWNGSNHKEINKTTKTDYYNATTIYKSYVAAANTAATDWQSMTTESGDTSIYANYTKHTLKFFYLERGAAVSNCKIRFNIPVLPSGSLSVKKEFDGIEKYGESFGFTLYDTTTGVNVPVSTAKYTLKSANKDDEVKTTDASGNFSLKVGEEAIFLLENAHTYSVIESNTGQKAVSYTCNLDGGSCISATETGSFKMTPESAHQAVFTNKVKTYNLKVSKIAYGSTEDETFEFQINLKDENDSPVDISDDIDSPNKYVVDHINGIVTFSLKNEESVIIKGIPLDTKIRLQETKHDGYQPIIKALEAVLANGDVADFTMDSAKDITVYNIPGVELPETGGSGILMYLVIGIGLMLISIKYGYSYFLTWKGSDD